MTDSTNGKPRLPVTQKMGPIRQNGYVVHDLDRAMHHWTTALGIGPFYYIETVDLDWFSHRGQPQSPHLSIALANSGPLQIELICQRDDTPRPQRRFSYFDSPAHRGTVLELSDMSGPKGEFFKHIRSTCANWDGKHPVRPVV